jgi:hypothetical protein
LLPFSSFAQIECENTSTGNIPLDDLGAGYFMGYQGGLYPGGVNTMPPAHQAAGISIAKSLKPLNEDGVIDPINGKIVMVAFGASTAGNTFNSFKEVVNPDPAYNPCLKFVNLCMGGKGLESMQTPLSSAYWDFWIDTLLSFSEISAAQVQVGWIKTASKDDSIPEFPLQSDSIYEKYIRSIQRAKQKFPNLKMLYIGSHPYGGYANIESDNADLAGEPPAYYQGFAVKWVITSQIAGDPRLKYKGADTKAPWIAWGPYVWADGMIPRVSDGLIWECTDYLDEGGGFHLSEAGRSKEANILIDFFATNPTSKKWFLSGPMWNACLPEEKTEGVNTVSGSNLELYPSPSNGSFYISFPTVPNTNYAISIFNNQGQRIFSETVSAPENDLTLPVNLQDANKGIYFIYITGGIQSMVHSFIVQ